jgi:hypothetical protein
MEISTPPSTVHNPLKTWPNLSLKGWSTLLNYMHTKHSCLANGKLRFYLLSKVLAQMNVSISMQLTVLGVQNGILLSCIMIYR